MDVKEIISRVAEKIKIKRQSRMVKNSLYNLTGLIIQLAFSFIFTPILIRIMGVENYGLWIVAGSLIGLMNIFQMGLGSGVVKYIAEYSSKDDRNGISSVITGTLIFYILIGVLMTVPLYYLSPRIVTLFKISDSLTLDSERTIQIASLGLIPLLLMGIIVSIPLGLQRYEVSNIISLVKNILTQVSVLVIVILGGKVYHAVIGTVIISWIYMLLTIYFVLKMLKPYKLRFFLSGITDVNFSHFQYIQ